MNSVQESKQELQAAIRYAENAISSAQATIESMEFRQEMAKKQRSEQKGREESLTKLVKELEEKVGDLESEVNALEQEVAELRDIIDRMGDDATGDSVTIKQLREKVEQLKSDRSGMQDCIKLRENQVDELKSEGALLTERIDEMKDAAFADASTIKHLKEVNQELESKVQGQYDDIVMLERDLTVKEAQASAWKKELDKLRKEKEASSAPCGCQGYRDLQEEAARLKSENIRLKASLDAAAEHIKDMREDLNDQVELDEEVRQGVNDFLDFLDTIGYERA